MLNILDSVYRSYFLSVAKFCLLNCSLMVKFHFHCLVRLLLVMQQSCEMWSNFMWPIFADTVRYIQVHSYIYVHNMYIHIHIYIPNSSVLTWLHDSYDCCPQDIQKININSQNVIVLQVGIVALQEVYNCMF